MKLSIETEQSQMQQLLEAQEMAEVSKDLETLMRATDADEVA